uniref:Uncharacterized protein n=1 Tax=Fusarium oxysporum (strain Fo5176) TaxID=660025 RepID=A0A0D2X8M8_FUSOF
MVSPRASSTRCDTSTPISPSTSTSPRTPRPTCTRLRSETSSARSSFAELSCSLVSMLRLPPPRRMSSSSLVTLWRTCRKVPPISSRSAGCETRISESSLTVCTSPRRATLSRTNKRGYGHGSCFFCVSGSQEWRRFIVACHVAKKGLQNKFQKAKR